MAAVRAGGRAVTARTYIGLANRCSAATSPLVDASTMVFEQRASLSDIPGGFKPPVSGSQSAMATLKYATSVHADLHSSEHAPKDARRALAPLGERLAPEVTRTLALVASELVTNSVRHGAGTQIELDATLRDDVVLLSVRDSGQGFQPGASTEADAGGGWGLRVVDQLVDRWWIEVDGGTRVTCELSR